MVYVKIVIVIVGANNNIQADGEAHNSYISRLIAPKLVNKLLEGYGKLRP